MKNKPQNLVIFKKGFLGYAERNNTAIQITKKGIIRIRPFGRKNWKSK